MWKHICRKLIDMHILCTYAYYTSLRMAEARRLLSLTAMTVSQISDALAFGNVSKFSYAFRSYYRMTPGQFRAAYRQSMAKE